MRTVKFITSSSFIVGSLFSLMLAIGLYLANSYFTTITEYTLQQTPDMQAIQQISKRYTLLMMAVLGSVVLLSFVIAWYVVNRINRMSNTINDIMNTGNLSARLEVDSSWDDLSKLSLVTNRMLQALETMVNDVKSVSDNIAHDLRTPLTRLRADIELSADNGHKHQLLAEVDNILTIFNSLLRIADIEAEKQVSAFKTHDLARIVDDIVSFYEALAEEKHISITLQTKPVELLCERNLVFQALANVIDNAIKFTPENGRIHIHLTVQKDAVKITICDTGPGVPKHLRDKISQRLFRVEHSRSAPGNGLGLALVAAVMQLHGGSLSFKDACNEPENLPGLCSILNFPR
ncbi:sensor histidine kinase [Planctobacterium marinum]|uniref:histidine kinase n=1 Tax=Planctobacterium marinum TaxID=1631968 RepID=A0AA48KUE6_9ALTE|nr:hypothetical protein MACH26_40300 [Planctobacterium marinum]